MFGWSSLPPAYLRYNAAAIKCFTFVDNELSFIPSIGFTKQCAGINEFIRWTVIKSCCNDYKFIIEFRANTGGDLWPRRRPTESP